MPRLLKLQAALDEQEARFARSADQQSLELALTHALLAADGGTGGGAPSLGSAATSAPAQVPGDLLQRLNRLEKELSTLRSAPRAAAPASAVPAAPAEKRGPAPAREAVREAAASIAPAAAPTQGSWADVMAQTTMQMRAFLKPARMHAQDGYVSLTYEDRSSFHAKQVAGKFDELAALVERVFGPITFELIAPEGLGRKREAGRAGGSQAAASAPAPTLNPAPTRSTPAPKADAPVEIPDFDPSPRRSRRGPEFEPVTVGAAQPQPVAAAQTASTQTPGTQTASAPPPSLPPRPRPGPVGLARRLRPGNLNSACPTRPAPTTWPPRRCLGTRPRPGRTSTPPSRPLPPPTPRAVTG